MQFQKILRIIEGRSCAIMEIKKLSSIDTVRSCAIMNFNDLEADPQTLLAHLGAASTLKSCSAMAKLS